MSLLKQLSGHPEYEALLKRAERERPIIPPWAVASNNVEDWKRQSSMQEGFDLCMAIWAPGWKPK